MKVRSDGMEQKYQIRVVKGNDDYIIIEENSSKEFIDAMFTWYVNHVEFFNGSIQLWYDEKCLVKTRGC